MSGEPFSGPPGPRGGGGERGGGWGRRAWRAALLGWWPAGAAALVLLARVAHFYNPYFVVDDAFISFRYAANLARGMGLVYNPGERVEGYSNFLWTVLTAAALRLGLEPVRFSIAVSLAAALGSLLLLQLWARRLFASPASPASSATPADEGTGGRGSAAAAGGTDGAARAVGTLLCALPPLLLAATGSTARYVVSGMETLLFGFLVLAAAYALMVSRRPGAAGALFALAAATRPEGAMYWLLAVGLTLWPGTESAPHDQASERPLAARGDGDDSAGWRRALRRPRWRQAAELAAVFLILFLPYFLWRWSYYGHPLPNTYYAKAGGFAWSRVARGAALLAEVCRSWSVYPLAFAALIALPAVRRSRTLALALVFVVVTVAYFLYVGGDFLAFFGPRFLMPVLPMLLLLAVCGVRRLATWRRRVHSAVVLAAGALLLANALWLTWPGEISNMAMIATEGQAWEQLGRWIAANSPSQAVLATGTAGIVPYYCMRTTIDMYGLADEHIAHRQPLAVGFKQVAHERFDPQYVLDRKPDLLISYCDRQGVPRQGGLARMVRRVRACYRPLLLIQADSVAPNGRWLIPSRTISPELYAAGYTTVLFERRQGRGLARCEAIDSEGHAAPAPAAPPGPAAAGAGGGPGGH